MVHGLFSHTTHHPSRRPIAPPPVQVRWHARANVQVARFVAELLMPNGDVHELHGYASIRLIKRSLIAAMVE